MEIVKSYTFFDRDIVGERKEFTQHHAKTTTSAEACILHDKICPKCGDKLKGKNGYFCIRDQIYWEVPEPVRYYP